MLPPATFHILLALAEEDRHGYAIIQDVAARTNGELKLSAGTLYRSIQRMLEQGLIVETRDRPAPEDDDERRRYYRITPHGMAAAKAEARRLGQLVKMARAAGYARRHDAALSPPPAVIRTRSEFSTGQISAPTSLDARGRILRRDCSSGSRPSPTSTQCVGVARRLAFRIFAMARSSLAGSPDRHHRVGAGVGATTAGSVADHVLLAAPVPASDRRQIWQDQSFRGYPRMEISPSNFLDWRRLAFDGMTAYL
jgi:DNA-binding PadR family transcriptional regulator